MLKRGRPSTITLSVDKNIISLADKKVKQLFKSKVRNFSSSSGAYIPMSQDFYDHEVFVIVLEKNE